MIFSMTENRFYPADINRFRSNDTGKNDCYLIKFKKNNHQTSEQIFKEKITEPPLENVNHPILK